MAKTIWPKSSPFRVARSLHAHSVLGIGAGALIYLLCLTGTLAVFNHELQRWEQPNAPEMTQVSAEAAARAATTVFNSEAEATSHLYISFPQKDLPRTVITTDNGAVFARADGTIAGREHFPWTQFLLDLHYYLHLPSTLGLFVVGGLGALLLSLSISGFMAHPKIFRDAFTFRSGRGRLTLVDLHNRLSVWTAPFHVFNVLTGTLLGLSSVLALTIAYSAFEGDTGKVFDPVFGFEPPRNEAHAPLAAIEAPIAHLYASYPDRPPLYFILHDPGTEGQHSSLIADHRDRLIFGEYYNYDADGAFVGTVGMASGTTGQQIFGSVYRIHFGSWGGLPVKLAYLGFGLALSIVVATGTSIYLARRREAGRPLEKGEGGWAAVVWGLPAVLTVTAIASFLGLEGRFLVALFWVLQVSLVLCGLWCGQGAIVRTQMQVTTSVSLILLVLVQAVIFPAEIFSDATLPVSMAMLSIAVIMGFMWFVNYQAKATQDGQRRATSLASH